MNQYSVKQGTPDTLLTREIAGTEWKHAETATIDVFPWDTSGRRQVATVRALYDDDALYLHYRVEDGHSVAETVELNDPVFEDSAVECFARPDPDRPYYFNFEVNCTGTFLLGWGSDRENREMIDPDLAEEITTETSIQGPTKDPSPDDRVWWLAAELPFETLAAFTNVDVSPEPGTSWRGNFQRLGGDSEYAVWNPIDAPDPDFHIPEAFGRFIFS